MALQTREDKAETPAVMLREIKSDPGALGSLVHRHYPMVYSTCLRIMRNRHDAEDATQAVFLCLAEQIRQNGEIRSPGPWLYQVACRASVDMYRRRKRRRNHESSRGAMAAEQHEVADPSQDMRADELQKLVLDALNELPRKYRLPLILHYFGGLTHEELAQDLGCNRVTLRVRMHRGHKLLRDSLQQRGITLAGGLVGVVLAEAVRSQIAQSMAAAPMAAAFRPIHPDVLVIANVAGCGIFRGKIVVGAVLAAMAGASALASPVLARIWREMPSLPELSMPQIPIPRLTAPLPQISKAQESSSEQPHAAHRKVMLPPVADTGGMTLPGRGLGTLSVTPRAMPLVDPPRQHEGIASVVERGAPVAGVPTRRVDRIDAPLASKAEEPRPVMPAFRQSNRPVRVGQRPDLTSPAVSVPTPPPTVPTPVIAVTWVSINPAHTSAWPTVTLPSGQTNGGSALTTLGTATTQLYSLATNDAIALRVQSFNVYMAGNNLCLADSAAYTPVRQAFSLENNGQVVSTSRSDIRDYSTYEEVRNSIDNPRTGVNGWFARNGGRVKLPTIHVAAGTNSYNWGESAADPTPDLINSLRLTPNLQQSAGQIRIDLLATDSSAVPTLPVPHHFIGVWSLEDTSVAAGGIDLLVRYDSTRIAAEHLDETQVKLWYFDTQWNRVWDVTKDLDSHTISGHIPSGTFFAVSTPEPSAVLAVIGVGGTILLRRRRT